MFVCIRWGVWIQWTGMVDWNGEMVVQLLICYDGPAVPTCPTGSIAFLCVLL